MNSSSIRHPVMAAAVEAAELPDQLGNTGPLEPRPLVMGPVSTTEQSRQFAAKHGTRICDAATRPAATPLQGNSSFEADLRAYRGLVNDFANMAPEYRGFSDVSELPAICADDMSLLARVKPEALVAALFADVQAECDRRDEEREADAETGGDLNGLPPRQHCMNLYGLKERDFS